VPQDNGISITKLKVPIVAVGLMIIQAVGAWAWIDTRIDEKVKIHKVSERELIAEQLDSLRKTLARHERKLDQLLER
jgi:hypothetical protein